MKSLRFGGILLFLSILYSCFIPAWTLTVATTQQIGKGLDQGIAVLPYIALSDAKLDDINKELIASKKEVTLEDTYLMAYGVPLNTAGPDGDTGALFTTMKEATAYFRKILKAHGMPDAERYILTSIDTANEQGYTLFAVVYRPRPAIDVIDRYDGATARSLTVEDRLYYEPYREDRDGKPLDSVVDWAGVPVDSYRTQKLQAVMLTLAANKVMERASRIDYWDIEKRWIAGGFGPICVEQDENLCSVMGIERGFMRTN